MSQDPSNPTVFEQGYAQEQNFDLPQDSKVRATIDKFLESLASEADTLSRALVKEKQEKRSKETALEQSKANHATTSSLHEIYESLERNYTSMLKRMATDNQGIVTELQETKTTFDGSFTEAVGAIKAARKSLTDSANQACIVATESNSGKVETNLPTKYIAHAPTLEFEAGQLVYEAQHIFNKFVKTAGLNGLLGLEALSSSIGSVVTGLTSLDTDVKDNLTALMAAVTADKTALMTAAEEEIGAVNQEEKSKQADAVLKVLSKEFKADESESTATFDAGLSRSSIVFGELIRPSNDTSDKVSVESLVNEANSEFEKTIEAFDKQLLEEIEQEVTPLPSPPKPVEPSPPAKETPRRGRRKKTSTDGDAEGKTDAT
ncbi:MAG: hypothetical protein AAFR59_10335 [Bacteroidota bacterium]